MGDGLAHGLDRQPAAGRPGCLPARPLATVNGSEVGQQTPLRGIPSISKVQQWIYSQSFLFRTGYHRESPRRLSYTPAEL